MEEDTSRFNWPDLIPKLRGWITGLITFVSAVAGFIQLWRGDTSLVTAVLLVAGVGGGWLGCAYLAFKRTPPLVEGGKGIWKYHRWRPWALAGLVIIPLLAVGGVGYNLYQQAQPPTKVIILVADFDGPEPQKYRVTETVLARLRQALEQYDDVKVEVLGQAITEAEGSAAARAEGEKRKATIVIWGWYGVTAEAVPLSVHFEVLRVPKYMPELGPEAKGLVQPMAVAELESFALQTRLSAEMAYLSLFTVGLVHVENEAYEAAVVFFSQALAQTEELVKAVSQGAIYFYRGTAYLSAGELAQAITDYNKAIELKPDDAAAYNNRGVAYTYKSEYDLAIADYDRALDLEPDNADVYNNRGAVYYYKGEYDQAIVDLNRAIELRPDDAYAYNNRGLAYGGKSEYDLAIADYDRAIELEPDLAWAYVNRGTIYTDKGEHDLAIADYDKVIELRPDFTEAYNNRGTAYADKGEYDLAIADYDKAIELKPDLAEVYNNRGFAYAHKGEYDLAIADYNRAMELKPDLAEVYNNRGFAYADQGEYNLAIADYDRAIELKPDYADAYNKRGNAYADRGEYDLAIADYDRAIELKPDYADAYNNRGNVYADKGENDLVHRGASLPTIRQPAPCRYRST